MYKLMVLNWNRRLESPVLRFGVSKTGLVPAIKDALVELRPQRANQQ